MQKKYSETDFVKYRAKYCSLINFSYILEKKLKRLTGLQLFISFLIGLPLSRGTMKAILVLFGYKFEWF